MKKESWCPGCGNFPIIGVFKSVKTDLNLETKDYVIVSGIGQAAKLPHFLGRINAFNGLHGRALPVATGIKLTNPKLKVLIFSGDGDLLSEGGNHFIHSARRNIGVTCFLHNNQVYGLTKGQASPTTDINFKTKIQDYGVVSHPIFPLQLALIGGAGFVARTFSGDFEHMKKIMIEAINYRGFAVVDILQPCVVYNKKNTFSWYRENTYKIDSNYNPTDYKNAMELVDKWAPQIPLGIIYKREESPYEDKVGITSINNPIKKSFGPFKKEVEYFGNLFS